MKYAIARNKSHLIFFEFALALLFAYYAAGWIVNPPPDRLLLLSTGSVVLFLSFLDWKKGVYFALAVMVFEGALRKWVFHGEQQLIYLFKDAILGAAYLRFFGDKIIRRAPLFTRTPLNLPLLFLFLWVALEMANPSIPNLKVSLFGLKAYFYYVPLFFMVTKLFDSKQAVFRFLTWCVFLSLPVLIFGIYQFSNPQNAALVAYLNWGQTAANAPAVGESYTRISGTFAFITGYWVYLFMVVLLATVLINLREKGWRYQKLFLFAIMILAIVNLVMTGTRWPVYALAVCIPLLFAMSGKISSGAILRALGLISLLIGVLFLVLSNYFKEAADIFWLRVTSSGDALTRAYVQVYAPIKDASVFGYGTGSTHQATRFLVNPAAVTYLPETSSEAETHHIMLELGAIGFILWYGLKFVLLGWAWSLRGRLRDPDLRLLAAMLLLIQIAYFYMTSIYDTTSALLYWFFTGLLLLLPKLDTQWEELSSMQT